MNNSAFGTIAGLEKSHYHTEFGTVFTHNGESYSPDWAAIAAGYGVKSARISNAEEFEQQLTIALESNQPFLIDCPMENIPVPTPGVWNINDIYTKKPNVLRGRLAFDDEKNENNS